MEKRKVDLVPQCISVAFRSKTKASKYISAEDLYQKFVDANSRYFWNLNLKEVFEKCHLVGHIKPHCLLIGGQDIFIQSIKVAYTKRLLKMPEPFDIVYLGNIDPVQCECLLPSQFVSLDESLCYIIYDLNLNGEISSFDMICSKLAEWYPSLQLPPPFLILATLRSLLDAGQVYYTGYGYSIMTSEKIMVAHWLDHHSSDKSVANSEPDDVKLEHSGLEDTLRTRPDIMNMSLYPSSPLPMYGERDRILKRSKTHSAIRQFFSKLNPRHHKAQTSLRAPIDSSQDQFWRDKSSYYTLSRTQPVFVSTIADLSSTRFVNTYHDSNLNKTNRPNRQWMWNTSLQSLSNVNPSAAKRSVSSHSKLSTKAIHDDSPPRNSFKHETMRSKSRSVRHKENEVHSSQTYRSSYGDQDHYRPLLNNSQLHDDSGIHSMSKSQSKGASDISVTSNRPKSQYVYTYREVEHEPKADQQVSPSVIRRHSQTSKRLTRSFSTRLSTLNPVLEGAK